jgi:hypothetical protein
MTRFRALSLRKDQRISSAVGMLASVAPRVPVMATAITPTGMYA